MLYIFNTDVFKKKSDLLYLVPSFQSFSDYFTHYLQVI